MKDRESGLIERCRRGDMRAFAELIAPYESKVYALAFRMCGNHSDAADLAQEAFIRVYSALSSFRGEAAFSTWLYRIVTNVCLDELRRRSRTMLEFYAGSGEEALRHRMVYYGEEQGPEEAYERKEIRLTIEEAIQALPEEQRMVIILRDVEGYSYQEVAEMLSLSLGTVKSRLNRARENLKELLARRELFPQTRRQNVKQQRGER